MSTRKTTPPKETKPKRKRRAAMKAPAKKKCLPGYDDDGEWEIDEEADGVTEFDRTVEGK